VLVLVKLVATLWRLYTPAGAAEQQAAGERREGQTCSASISGIDFSQAEVGAFYWTVLAHDIVNSGWEEQGSVSV
jgi:hypothetical protein